MKVEAILLHSDRFAELADFYRRALEHVDGRADVHELPHPLGLSLG